MYKPIRCKDRAIGYRIIDTANPTKEPLGFYRTWKAAQNRAAYLNMIAQSPITHQDDD